MALVGRRQNSIDTRGELPCSGKVCSSIGSFYLR